MNKDRVRSEIIGMQALSVLNSALRGKVADVFLGIAVPQRIAVNTTIFRRGDASDDQGLILIEGELRIEKENSPEFTAFAPDIIGEMAQLNPTKQRTATVVAATDLHVLRFTWPAFSRAAQTALTEAEAQAFTAALQEFAWKHFTE